MSSSGHALPNNGTPSRKAWTLRDVIQGMFFFFIMKPIMFIFIGLRVRGKEYLLKSGQFILVANHSSHLDTASLLSLFPFWRLRNIRPVAAADYFERTRFFSILTKTLFNILPIARTHITTESNPLPPMLKALNAGQSLIIFPEGSRGTNVDVRPFRSGVAHLIEKAPHIPVIPAYLINMGRILPKGEYIPLPLFCEIRIGPPRVMHGSRHDIMCSLEDAVRELKDWHE